MAVAADSPEAAEAAEAAGAGRNMTRFSFFSLVAALLEACIVLPQLFRTIRLRSVADLSILMWLAFFVGSSMWLWYGVLQQDTMIIAISTFNIIKDILMLGLFFIFNRKIKHAN